MSQSCVEDTRDKAKCHARLARELRPNLKLVDLLLVVTELLQVTGQVALVKGTVLTTADSLVHAGGSADKDLDVLLLGFRQDRLQEFLGHVAFATGPLLGRLVEKVECLKTLRVGVLQVLELLLQEDVLLADVSVDKGNLGLVVGVLEDGADQLVHGRDTGTTGDQGNVGVLIGFPGVLGERSLEVEALANIHAVQVRRHGSIGVALDDELQVSGCV